MRMVLSAVVIALVSGCAQHFTSEAVADPYGFLWGIWHGLVFPLAVFVNVLSWLLSLIGISFLDSIQIIGRPNTGFWYYAGFAIGLTSSGSPAAR